MMTCPQNYLLLVPWQAKTILRYTTWPRADIPKRLAEWSKGFGHALLSEMGVRFPLLAVVWHYCR